MERLGATRIFLLSCTYLAIDDEEQPGATAGMMRGYGQPKVLEKFAF
jgi:hypothetical protein